MRVDTEPGPAEPAGESSPVQVDPIESRFLFVDVAAQRAKQLRRGALPRLSREPFRESPRKLERLAMEEVRHGLVEYTLPTPGSVAREETA